MKNVAVTPVFINIFCSHHLFNLAFTPVVQVCMAAVAQTLAHLLL